MKFNLNKNQYGILIVVALVMTGGVSILVSGLRHQPLPAADTSAVQQAALAFQGGIHDIVDNTPKETFIEIYDACDHAYQGSCVNVRTGPGTSYPSVLRLRNGVVLSVDPQTVTDSDGQEWYKVLFEDNVRYPERVTTDWYVAKVRGSVHEFQDVGTLNATKETPKDTKKRIVVDLSDETLTAYDGDTVFMKETISRGVEENPTPVGMFSVYKKTPSRYMQGPLPGETDEYYDLPGVPWDLYFSPDGAVLHGAYWHDDFGTPRSHGCVNQSPENARKLYQWADLGTSVIVQK